MLCDDPVSALRGLGPSQYIVGAGEYAIVRVAVPDANDLNTGVQINAPLEIVQIELEVMRRVFVNVANRELMAVTKNQPTPFGVGIP